MICPNGHDSAASDYCDTCGEVMAAGGPGDLSLPDDGAAGPAPGVSGAATPGGESSSAAADEPCPNCSAPNPPDALFCEACGYDHTTGAVPQPLAPPSLLPPADAPDPTGTSGPSGAAGDPGAGAAGASGPAGASLPDAGMPLSPLHPAPRPAAPTPADNPAPTLSEPWVVEVWIDPDWYAQQSSPDPLPSAGPPRVLPLRHTSVLVGRASVSRGITPDVDCGADNGVSRRHAQLTTDGTRWWVEDLGSSNGTFVADAVDPIPVTPLDPGTKREVAADDRVYLGSWTRLVIRPADPGELDTP